MSVAWLGSATSPRVLCLGSAGSLAVPCLGSGCLVLTCSKRSKSGKGSETTTAATQARPAAEGGCVVVSEPLPLVDLSEQVKTRQTELRQATACEPAEPRQSTPGEVVEPSQATLSARTTTQRRRQSRRSYCSRRESCLAWLCQEPLPPRLEYSALARLARLLCLASTRSVLS